MTRASSSMDEACMGPAETCRAVFQCTAQRGSPPLTHATHPNTQRHRPHGPLPLCAAEHAAGGVVGAQGSCLAGVQGCVPSQAGAAVRGAHQCAGGLKSSTGGHGVPLGRTPPPPTHTQKQGVKTCPSRLSWPQGCTASMWGPHGRGSPAACPLALQGQLECGYHGWAWSGSGKCEAIPQVRGSFLAAAVDAECCPATCMARVWSRGVHTPTNMAF